MLDCVIFGDPYTRDALRGTGAIVIKGMFEPDEMAELMDRLSSSFQQNRDGEGEIGPGTRAQVMRDVPDGALPRRLRMFYEPPTRSIFRRLGELRNSLAGLPPSWAMDAPEDGWWTAARFNQYPKGGGFMAEHSDAEYVGSTPPGGFVQPVLFLTERGRDYAAGGAYMRGASGIEDAESLCLAGDVLVYDGAIRHGVAPIDPNLQDESRLFGGRVVAAVTTLRVL